MSVLEIESELEWNPTVTTISSMPLSIYDDGSILYFK
jgi:ubiquitin carboxyl-terminal hydrolase 47